MAGGKLKRVLGVIEDFAVKGAKAARKEPKRTPKLPASKPLAVNPKAKAPVKALPAPQRPLALPPPGPGLPPLASKPRGGQWWANKEIEGVNSSPEAVASKQAGDLGYRFLEWQPDDDYGLISMQVPEIPKEQFTVQDWLSRALAKYYKNDFGSPEDPLRSLAERGLHYDPDMTPEKWKATVDSYLLQDPLQQVMFPTNRQGGMPGAGDDFRGGVLSQMPWLSKVPATENIYGISGGGLDLEHFADEFYNALNPEVSGIPSNLAVRKESLDRMTFPQAVEQVGKINQWRVKEMERAALAAQENPVTQIFKEYTEDNPMGLRWVEIAPPKGDGPTNYDVEEELRKALKYEGDTMGHCVGGYCPDVMSGRSRIFSLRDAKGEPHVTVETSPRNRNAAALEHIRSLGAYPDWVKYSNANRDMSIDAHDLSARFLEERGLPPVDYSGQDILQIKGKQNRAPKDDYLPFVQDFVKSGQWGNVDDLANTGLVRLPDGRYITTQQAEEGIRAMPGIGVYSYEALQDMSPEEWAANSVAFEGYAIGGRVERDRCFCRHPMAVR